MVPVSSSQIQSIGYDPGTKKAQVRFSNNALYEYDDVPIGVVDSIINAESPGRQFQSSLKFGFNYRRLE